MKSLLLSLIFTGICITVSAQDFTGQWKGEFIDKSSSTKSWAGDKCEYVLDLEFKGNQVSGFSYTYFNGDGKRLYTICRLKGTVDKSKNYVEIEEVERTKTNVPVQFSNCFQVHRLTYTKTADGESLAGSWVPAPNQSGGCGYGTTALYKRTLRSSIPKFNSTPKSGVAKTTPSKTPAKTSTATAKKPAATPPVAKVTTPKKNVPETSLTPNKGNMPVESTPSVQVPVTINNIPLNYEKRGNALLKTLEVENDVVKVELYDNGEVDGDSISLYYNNELLLGKKRLTTKPITLNLTVPAGSNVNELVMFAENLGTIPPNTALMVVTDGTKRYEVRITSDLQKSGTIRFVHKKNN
ncbi:hypothetical protein [Ferruginibacter sp. HRS2-29]|uniref:hypothetical protein n=1 Tax=Ferruginibacter sp. HRS2-29 TaxID=2487334 RepID=UPI0020CE388A|nr:hypothetical protein [Ferruginibacter sp. HRS2-29]MCP9750629.1 hypothetical protein [Ferruginibacter sp. HRS2-29]